MSIKHLHIIGYAHRNIRPENMMLDHCGHLKLIGFSSSAKLNDNEEIDTPIPDITSEYLAPEILTVSVLIRFLKILSLF